MRGLLIVLSGPSGAGKGTVVNKLLENSDNIKLSISATTRAPRENEIDGVNYFFLEKQDFLDKANNGKMLEYASYCDNYYGTPSEPIEKWRNEGYDVILEIETNGAFQVRDKVNDAVLIFLAPPSLDELKTRLLTRNTEPIHVIEERLNTAKMELECAFSYDYIMINDKVESSVATLKSIIEAEKHKSSRVNIFV